MTDPGDILDTALAKQKAGLFEEAVALFASVIDTDPQFADAAALTDYGNVLQRMGDHSKAADIFNKACLLDPASPEAHTGLGNALLSLGQFEPCINAFEKALAATPSDVSLLNSLGSAWLANGYAHKALNYLERALNLEPDSANAHFNSAIALSTLDDFAQAAEHFGTAAKIKPDWALAHINTAATLNRAGRGAEAIPWFRSGLQLAPENLTAMRDLAGALIDVGEREEPRQMLNRYLDHHPDDPDCYYMLGNLARLERNFEQAVEYHQKSRSLGGDADDNSVNMATALLELKRPAEAEEVLLKALIENPGFAEGWNNLGNAYVARKHFAEATKAYERALTIDASLTSAANNMATCYLRAGQFDVALKQAQQNSLSAPDNADSWTGLGTVLLTLEDFEEALVAFEKALAIDPDHLDARHNRAVTLHRLALFEAARSDYEAVLQLAPYRQQSWFNLGNLFQVLSRHGDAVNAFQTALAIDPDYAAAWSFLAHSLKHECRWDELDEVATQAIEHTRQEIECGAEVSSSPFSLMQLAAPGEVRLAAARQVSQSAAEVARLTAEETPFSYPAPTGKKLRIGYISPDFREHSVGRTFQELLSRHDRERFELFGYYTGSHSDSVTKSLSRNFDSFVELADQPFAEAARRINDDNIHILVDLAGHTRGARLEVLARRPAPVQAHFLGYGFTLGADFIDYLITDETTIPDTERPWCHENIVYLPHHSLPASRPEFSDIETDRKAQGLPDDAFVFANFNGHYKFDADVFTAWMEILKKTNNSVLWLLQSSGESGSNLCQQAERHGVDPARLVFAEKTGNAEHLSRLSLADLALDTWQHAGGVTSIDALWAGLPVLSVVTNDLIDRTGASLLLAANMPELVASSREDYVQKAIQVAGSPESTSRLKSKLRSNQHSAPLFDTPSFTRYLEKAYEAMWQAYIKGEDAKTIYISSSQD
jgi:protein O-GlcNAc transferase